MKVRAAVATGAATAVGALMLGGCGGSPENTASTVTIDVYAAASLSAVFTSLAERYEAANPDVDVRLTFAGSADLAAQINEGAPADVFASANEAQMDAVAEHLDGVPTLFASNTLTIAVPTGNPAGVTGFVSLAAPGLALVICAPEVPCGAATVTVEKTLGVTLSPVSELTSVTDVLGAVSSGEADAGLVYVTDIGRAQGVEGIPFVGADAAVSRYPIAALQTGSATDVAAAFVAFVLGPEGQAALKLAGFGPPDAVASE